MNIQLIGSGVGTSQKGQIWLLQRQNSVHFPKTTTLKKSEYSFQSLKLLNFDNLLEAVREVPLGDDPYIFAAW